MPRKVVTALFPDDRREEGFWNFHLKNPEIWRLFQKFCAELTQAGRKRYSARAIFHRIRWHYAISTTDPEFKICNNWSPFYAKMWLTLNPHHPNFFQLKKRR